MTIRLSLLTLLITLFSAGGVLSQGLSIRGRVTEATKGEGVGFATVFLSNSSKVTMTDEKGNYVLPNVSSGQYELIVKVVGYKTSSQTVFLADKSLTADVVIQEDNVQLKAVEVKPDADFWSNYQAFKKDFLGTTPNAAQCRIVNPEVLRITFDRDSNKLTAESVDFLIIENKALGYRVRFLLGEFETDYRNRFTYYQGRTVFEPMKGGQAAQRRWQKKRMEAYLGSAMHFYRSLREGNPQGNGFDVYRLQRIPNPDRAPENVIREKLRQFSLAKSPMLTDSLAYWRKERAKPKELSVRGGSPLNATSLVRRTDVKTMWALAFEDYLYVLYRGDLGSDISRLAAADRVSVLSLTAPYILFDLNGIVVNSRSVTYEGAWTERVANMLPFDFQPNN
jgi:hypothetical protein